MINEYYIQNHYFSKFLIEKISMIIFKSIRIISKVKTEEEYFKSHLVTNKFIINKRAELEEKIINNISKHLVLTPLQQTV